MDKYTIEDIIELSNDKTYKKELEDFDVAVEGGNPGCGDIVKIYLKVNEQEIVKASYVGNGCTISQASANLLMYHINNKKLNEIENIDIDFIKQELGENIYLLRPNCASLAINVLKATIKKYYRTKNLK
ncbi:MAG: iron-sulfur cluster assembly scaffold protein [bacterium]|nr:iron-sulfur cluster assembly scaffold protein [bacterium]